ncbi:MAG TPA: hypothetical protein PKU97_22815, partial [Kofleriaceae bacterium]|nr:hypothetical protein [Kofleriaceae bacterium]
MKRATQDRSGVTSGERPFEDRALTATASPRAGGLLHHRWMFPLLLGLAACASVLGLRRDSGNTPFPHRAHVLAGVSCVRCHRDIEKPRPLLAPPAPAAPAAPAASAAVAAPAAAASAAATPRRDLAR